MAVRVLMISVLVAVAAALIPTFMESNDVHAAEALQPAAVTPVFAAVTEDPAPESVVPGNRLAEIILPVVAAPEPAEVRVVPAAVPMIEAPAVVAVEVPTADSEPAVEPVAVETAAVPAAAPAAATATSGAAASASAPVETAPAAVAGYIIGDLAPQGASANAGSPALAMTGGQMLPEGIDVDPNSDMVEILIPSAGQGAMFPAEIEADYSTDMVAIVIPDGAMFPAGNDGDLSADMVEILAG